MPGYNSVADMAEDLALNRRLTAAVAKEGILDPKGWLYPRNWQVVSAPGWDAKWDSAVAGGVQNPGEDEAVITDGDILSAVQAVIASATAIFLTAHKIRCQPGLADLFMLPSPSDRPRSNRFQHSSPTIANGN